MPISPLILLAVFILIAVRRIGRYTFKIWQVMLGGAVLVLVTGQISPPAALAAIDLDVMLFLFGMFVIGQALEESGWLAHVTHNFFKRARTSNQLLLLVLFGLGLASAVLMNDTLAVIGTPLVLHLARQHRINPKMLLLALAVAVTIGSVPSPIGNPQNLLVAMHGNVANPFITFGLYLLVPTLLNLGIAFFVIKHFYREQFQGQELEHDQEPVRDEKLARLAKVSLGIIVALIAAKTILSLCGMDHGFRLTYIALVGALPILLFSPCRWPVLKKIDWHTLVFFAAMFVLMQSVWDAGFFQHLLTRWRVDVGSITIILLVSVVLSQFISNVPLVALYLPLLLLAGIGQEELMALAAGSTIAGNLSVLGAASNVIIIQAAEKRTGATLTFTEFSKVGVPLTLLNVAVYWLYFKFL